MKNLNSSFLSVPLKKIFIPFFIIILACITGCASSTCIKENLNPYLNKPTNAENYSKVIFYNTSSLLWCWDQLCAAVNITLDGKHIARLARDNFLEIYIKKGESNLSLDHWDIFIFKNDYILNLTEDVTYIEIFSRPVSTQFKIKDKLSEDFYEKFNKACSGR